MIADESVADLVPGPGLGVGRRADADVDLGAAGAHDVELEVQIGFQRHVAEVDLADVPVLLLGQVERELKVQLQVVVAGGQHRHRRRRHVARRRARQRQQPRRVVVGHVAPLAMVAHHALNKIVSFP